MTKDKLTKIICPTCKNDCYIGLDEWGHTPFHLHCDKCNINIGATSISKCVELLKDHCKPRTWIEFYNNKINILWEEGVCICSNSGMTLE